MKKLFLSILLIISLLTAESQLVLDLGASKTDLKNNAVTVGITYLQSLDSIFGGQELFIPGKNSFFMVVPEIDIRTGTEDAYSSINIKASGLFNVFKTKTVAGLIAPDYNKTFHSFPVSLGVETNNQFNNVNGIVEVGWVPYYQSYARNSPQFVKQSRFGIFIQTGYKFSDDSTGIGGEIYEGKEQAKKGILRGRGIFTVDTDAIIRISNVKVGLVGSAEGWADIANSEFYHKVEGRVRVYLNENQYFDVIGSSGSGAPLFNQATQYGVGMTIKL